MRVWLLGLISIAALQAADLDLPKGAVIIERAQIPRDFSSNRELVLWMISPEKHERGAGEPYTCPETTQGNYYSGPTRISLVNSDTQTIVNSISLRGADGDPDSFDVPYSIVPDYYYAVPGREKGSEGKPRLLDLRDVNGDGLPLETAFYQALGCMGLPTMLVGYSPKQDKVIRYEIEMTKSDSPSGKTETQTWVDYLFAKKPVSPGHWQFQIDYSGRGGNLEKYDIRYDAAKEEFFGTMTTGPGAWSN